MRIDLPQCGLDSCKYSFDGNCTNKQRYQGCEFAYFKRLEAADRLIELPCKVGDAVWLVEKDFPQYPPIKFKFPRKSDIMREMEKGMIFAKTKEEAEAKLAELGGRT